MGRRDTVRHVPALLLLLLLVGCGLEPVTEPRRSNFAGEPTPLPLRQLTERPTHTVTRGTVTDQLELLGRVGSTNEVPLQADQDGIVSAVLVKNETAVVAGDTLALFNTESLDAQINETERLLSVAQGRMKFQENLLETDRQSAALTLERAELSLADAQARGLTTDQLRVYEIDIDVAQLALDQIEQNPNPELQAEILELEIQLAELQDVQTKTRLITPFDGDLIGLNLAAGVRVRGGTEIAVLVNLAEPVVWADAIDSQLALLEAGLPVLLTQPFAPDQIFAGEIATLPYPHGVGEITDGARAKSIQIVTETPLEFGERIDVVIPLQEKPDVLWLPPDAVREFAGEPFVIVRDGNDERRVTVELGIEGVTRVEVIVGLEEGDVVVLP